MGILDIFKKKKEGSRQEPSRNEIDSVTLGGKTVTFDEKTKANLQIDQQALAAYERKDYSKALGLYSELIESEPTAHQYYQFRGTVYEDMGNDTMAQKDFEKSIELEPENSTSLYRLAMVYHRKNDLEKAVIYLRKAYDILAKHDKELGKEFGYKDLMGNSYNNILMVHRRVIAFNLANFLVQLNRVDEGLVILDELIEYCPTYSYPYFVKALVLAQKNDLPRAIDFAQKATLFGHPQGKSLLTQLKSLSTSSAPKENKYSSMINNASYNPFNISADPRLQNQSDLPDLVDVFTRELSGAYANIVAIHKESDQDFLKRMAKGYAFNMIESYYKNAGYVPQNSLDQILEQVYEAMGRTGFDDAYEAFDDFKYECYYSFLNR